MKTLRTWLCCLSALTCLSISSVAQEVVEPVVDLGSTIRAQSPGQPVTVTVEILEFATDDKQLTPMKPEQSQQTLARIRRLEQEKQPRVATRMRLTTLENVAAQAQHGENVSVPSGRVSTASRTPETTYVRDDSGTIVLVTPKLEDNGQIRLDLTVEQSRYRHSPASSKDQSQTGKGENGEFVPPAKDLLTVKSTLRLPNGETMIAHLMEGSSGESHIVRAVLVTAETTDAGDR